MIDKLTNGINDGLLFKVSFILLVMGFLTIPLSKVSEVDSILIDKSYLEAQGTIDSATLDKMFNRTIKGKKFVEGKEVGYLSAINWWPNNTIFIPLLVFILGWLLVAIKQTHHTLAKSGMIIDEETRKVVDDGKIINDEWVAYLRGGVKIWLYLCVVAFLYSYFEFYVESYIPTTSGKINATVSPDWSIGCFLSSCNQKLNMFFSAYAFTIQGLNASFGLLLFCVSGSYGFFIYRHSNINNSNNWFFVPNINSHDKRKGFESFEEIGMLLLMLGLLAYTVIYLIILQNQYLADNNSTSLFGGDNPFLDLTTGLGMFINLSELSNAIALMLGFFVVIVIVAVVPSITLSLAASKSRKNYYEMNGDSVMDKLKHMVYWPYRWIKINVLILALILCLFGLLLPSLAPYLATVYCTSLVGFIVWKIKDSFNVSDT